MIRSPAGFDGGDRIKRYLDYYQPSYGVMMLSAGQAFSPASLFAAGEQGAWYDPSDLTTMFTDSAGTTPVTAVEQAVGRINDKSGRGNHATQSTSNSRPVLRARYNLLTYSEQFDNAAWVAARSGTAALGVKTNNFGVAPDGTTTAARIQLDVSAGSVGNQSQVYEFFTSVANAQHTYSAWIRTNDNSTKTIKPLSFGVAGTITVTGTWQRFEALRTPSSTTDAFQFILSKGDTSDTADLLVWHPDVRVTNESASLPAYQRIAAATDYDTTGFLPYLAFDGTDDSLATAAIDFSATDKMSVFAGVRKLSDAAAAFIVELSANSSTGNNGSFGIGAASSATTNYFVQLYGSGLGFYVPSPYAAPLTNTISAILDTSASTLATEIIPSVNGVVSQQGGSGSAGTGNFGAAYPLYIGRRGGSSLPFNGRLYSLIVLGRTATAAEISNTERWVNGKTMAY